MASPRRADGDLAGHGWAVANGDAPGVDGHAVVLDDDHGMVVHPLGGVCGVGGVLDAVGHGEGCWACFVVPSPVMQPVVAGNGTRRSSARKGKEMTLMKSSILREGDLGLGPSSTS